MPFDFDTPKTFFEKTTKAIDWIVEEIVRQKNWRSLLALLDVILFIAFNPFQWPFPNLLSLSPQLEKSSWYAPVFWSLIGVIFVIAVIVAARAKRKPAERPDLKQGAIKGLLPFGYEDAEVFSHLQRDQNLKECLQAIGDEQWRLGEPSYGSHPAAYRRTPRARRTETSKRHCHAKPWLPVGRGGIRSR